MRKEVETEEKWLYEKYTTDNYMDINNPELRQAKKDLLKQGYSTTKRCFEITWTIFFAVLLPLSIYNIASNMAYRFIIPVVIGMFSGIVFADFMSGLVHWTADTWGTLDWPFVGPSFIRSFREHHVDPTAMCKHDWIETNGDNFMLVVLPLFYIAIKDLSVNGDTSLWYILQASFLLTTCCGVALTNQIHKWSHTYDPPTIVTILQKYRIILPKSNHTLHHRPAFDGYYCITTGWLNPILDTFYFWRIFERIINKLTGLIPREDDWKWTGLVKDTPDVVQNYIAKQKTKLM